MLVKKYGKYCLFACSISASITVSISLQCVVDNGIDLPLKKKKNEPCPSLNFSTFCSTLNVDMKFKDSAV